MIWTSFFSKRNIKEDEEAELVETTVHQKEHNKISGITVKSIAAIFGTLLVKGCFAVLIFHFLGGNLFLETLPDLPTILDNLMSKGLSGCEFPSTGGISSIKNTSHIQIFEIPSEYEFYQSFRGC